jgi:hypothetical protein
LALPAQGKKRAKPDKEWRFQQVLGVLPAIGPSPTATASILARQFSN